MPVLPAVRHAAAPVRVLMVEDHARLAATVAAVLRREGMAVDVAFDGRQALARAALTEAGSIEDRVEGLGIGADVYLPKPFHLSELVARIRALARRSRRVLPPRLAYGDLELDSSHREVTR